LCLDGIDATDGDTGVNDHIVPWQGVWDAGQADAASDAGKLHDAKRQLLGRFRPLQHETRDT
jgi:hypothetical protein